MMRILATLVFALTFAGSAAAFQQSTEGSKAVTAVADPATLQAPKEPGKLDLSEALPKTSGKDGTAVRIPGIGTLGVLPKLDFGLELLYGDPEPQIKETTPKDRDDALDDLRIRGTFRHRF